MISELAIATYTQQSHIAFVSAQGLAIISIILLCVAPFLPRPMRSFQYGIDAFLSVCLLSVFILRSLASEFFALTNMFESLLAVALGVVICRYILEPRIRIQSFHVLSMGLVLVALGFATTLPSEIAILQPALMSYWRAIHVPIIMLSYALLFMASIAGVLMIIKRGSSPPLQRERIGERGFSQLDQETDCPLTQLADRAVYLAVPTLAIGTALGAVWANEAWGTYWNWDPKENMALATLFVYGAYMHMRLNTQIKPQSLAWLLVIGFAVVMLTYIGINLLGVGLHSYGNFMMS